MGSEHEYRLVRDLMARYNKQVRPSINSSEALNVTFGAGLAQIIDVVSRVEITSFHFIANMVKITNEILKKQE